MTKDEFLDIMGEIDEDIIDGALDVSHRDGVTRPYKRTPVLKYVLSAAACIALVFAAGAAVRYFNVKDLFFNHANSGGDFISDWDPDDIAVNNNLMIGSSTVVSTAELEGRFTVSLIMHDITKLPGKKYSANGHDYTDYWGARDIALYIKYANGKRSLFEHVTPHSDGGMEFIHDKCLFEGSTRVLDTGSDFNPTYTYIPEHVVMQYADYDAENDALIARFFEPRGEKLEYNDHINPTYDLQPYIIDGIDRIGGWKYGYQASENFYREYGAVYADPEYGYEINFYIPWRAMAVYPDRINRDENLSGYVNDTLTGWDPEKLKYDPSPKAGESAVVSAATVDDLTVSLILYNVIKRPEEDHYLYSGDEWKNLWVADEIYLYAKDGSGRKLMWELPTPLSAEYAKGIPADCIFDGSTRLIKAIMDGEEHYLLIQHYKPDGGDTLAHFYDLNIDLSDANPERDENGILKIGKLIRPFGVYRSGSIYSSIYGSPVSESFAHKTGSTFADPVNGYEITFDTAKGKAEVIYK